jgi:hypothetical protein
VIPPFQLRLQVPKLPGQDTSNLDKYLWGAQSNRKVFHVNCEKQVAQDIKRLVQYAKEFGLIKKMWGRHAHVSKVVDKAPSNSKIKQLVKVTQRHTNYQCLTILKDIVGVANLDGSEALYNKGKEDVTLGILSLQLVLLQHLKLSNGHQLIC